MVLVVIALAWQLGRFRLIPAQSLCVLLKVTNCVEVISLAMWVYYRSGCEGQLSAVCAEASSRMMQFSPRKVLVH